MNKNMWTNGKKTVKFVVAEADAHRIPEGWYPAVSMSRVSGSTYRPYVGNDVWTRRANEILANHARANFEINGR